MRHRTFVNFEPSMFSVFPNFAREMAREMESEISREAARGFYETEEAFLGSFDLPGVVANDINIELEDNLLTITAERKNPFDKTGEATRKYSQTFSLPKTVEFEKINAHYENGVLSLTLPKIVVQKNKLKIPIVTGEKPKSWTNFLGFGSKQEEKALN